MKLNANFVRSILEYDRETGQFLWRVRADKDARWNNRFAGMRAGWRGPDGYIRITINYTTYTAHRLAWLYVHGAWPPHQVDHINGGRSDNRIANLRLATNTENSRNAAAGKNNTSGFKGVSFHKRAGRWNAAITVSGRSLYLGLFDTPEEAHAAYVQAAQKNFGEFART